MLGVVFTGDRTLDLTEVPDPAPGPLNVVLEMKASGLCGSDLKLYRGAKGFQPCLARPQAAARSRSLPVTSHAGWSPRSGARFLPVTGISATG